MDKNINTKIPRLLYAITVIALDNEIMNAMKNIK